jgi:hypothetical protein
LKWPKSAGKSIDEYIKEANVSLRREQFGADFHRHLNREESVPTLDSSHVDSLWEIMRGYLSYRQAVEAIKNDGFIEDLKSRRRLTKKLTKYFEGGVEKLDSGERNPGPSTRRLLGSMRSRIDQALKELQEISEIDRLLVSRYAAVAASAKTPADTVWELDQYLKKVCGMKAEQRNLLISATMVAAGLAEDSGEDFVESVATRRSRALRKFAGDEMQVDWLAKVPRLRNHNGS